VCTTSGQGIQSAKGLWSSKQAQPKELHSALQQPLVLLSRAVQAQCKQLGTTDKVGKGLKVWEWHVIELAQCS